jgi:hypothetical protein
MEKTILKTLTDFFNVGDGKRPLADWAKEVRALSDAEKRELAEGVSAITGDGLKN